MGLYINITFLSSIFDRYFAGKLHIDVTTRQIGRGTFLSSVSAGICTKSIFLPIFMRIRAWFWWYTFLSSVLHRYFAGIVHFDAVTPSNLPLKLFYLLFHIAIYTKFTFRPKILWEHDVIGINLGNWAIQCYGHKGVSNGAKPQGKETEAEKKERNHIETEMNISFGNFENKSPFHPFHNSLCKSAQKMFFFGKLWPGPL